MAGHQAGVNAIVAGGQEYLLVEVGGGSSIHLTSPATAPDEHSAAVPSERMDKESRRASAPYDAHLLLERRWAPRTLCGREWIGMAAGDAGLLHRYQEIAVAPSCRRYLASLDRLFPQPVLDDRIELICSLVVDAVSSHGYAEVTHVPGDQMKVLRTTARRNIREQLGFGSRTYVYGDNRVLIHCDEAYEAVNDRTDQALADVLDSISIVGEKGAEPFDDSEWRFSWHAWG